MPSFLIAFHSFLPLRIVWQGWRL